MFENFCWKHFVGVSRTSFLSGNPAYKHFEHKLKARLKKIDHMIRKIDFDFLLKIPTTKRIQARETF